MQIITKPMVLAGLVAVFLLTVMPRMAYPEEKSYQECPFATSLHYTGEGMRYWYEEPGGFMGITDVPYRQAGCNGCHVSSCGACHTAKEGEKCSYSTSKAKEKETCLVCHARAKAAIGIGEKTDAPDVHLSRGLGCSDCHSGEDVHGDGTQYHSMRDSGAVKVECGNCHQFDPTSMSRSHKIHYGRLDCTACHVSNSLTCLNCHFDNFVATGKKEGNFIPPSGDWLLLINYQGKVTSGTVQTLVSKDKKFIAYAPYFTHAVQPKGRKCADCHANEAVKLMKQGGKVPMAAFKEGKVVSWQGVVPVVPEQLEWVYLNKKEDQWVPITNTEPEKVQFVGHGTPLTKKQMNVLAVPFKH